MPNLCLGTGGWPNRFASGFEGLAGACDLAGGGGATLAGVLPAILSLSSCPGFGWYGCAEAVGDVLGIPLMAWKSALFFSGLAARVVAGFAAAFLTPPADTILFAGRVEPLEPGGAEIRLLRAFGFGCVSRCLRYERESSRSWSHRVGQNELPRC